MLADDTFACHVAEYPAQANWWVFIPVRSDPMRTSECVPGSDLAGRLSAEAKYTWFGWMMKEDVGQKTDFGGDAFKIRPHSHECVRGKGSAALFSKLLAPAILEPCSTPQCVSHVVKNCPKRRTRSCACSPWSCGLYPARSPASSFGSGSQQVPQLRRGRRGLFTKPASCRCLGLCASPPLPLAVSSRQPDIFSQQSFKEMSAQESDRCVTATRVSDFAVWDDLFVTCASGKSVPKKMKN